MNEQRTLVYMDLDEIVPADRNPKNHAKQQIAASMERFNFTEPVLLDERTGKLVAGHGRQEELLRRRAAGERAPGGITVEDGKWFVPVVRGWASQDDAEAAAYGIASNRLTELGGWDSDELFDMLKQIAATDVGLDGIGYTADEMSDLAALLDGPLSLDQLSDEHGEPGERDLWPAIRLIVSPDAHQRFLEFRKSCENPNDDDVVLRALLP